jgi:SAM-dependent methyltransferase
VNEAEFRDYWTLRGKTDSDHVLREGFDVFRIGAAEIQPWLDGAKRVLEIGCGAGELFSHLRLDRSAYLGVDFSRSMLDEFARRHPGVRVQLGEAASFTTREEFDFIIINNVVQYCAPWMTLACLQNAAEMLANGGRIFLGNVPHRGLRVPLLAGAFDPARPRALARLWRRLRARLFVAFNPTDRIGYWYAPDEIARFAAPLGLDCAIFGCLLYPYRFTAILTKPRAS